MGKKRRKSYGTGQTSLDRIAEQRARKTFPVRLVGHTAPILIPADAVGYQIDPERLAESHAKEYASYHPELFTAGGKTS